MFLVNYDIQNWQLISESLLSPDKIIPAETRRKLVQDSMLLASAEELSLVTALNLTMFLFNETDYVVWMPFLQHINSIDQITKYMSLTPKLNVSFYINLFKKMFECSLQMSFALLHYTFSMWSWL